MTWWLNSVEVVFVVASAGACFGGFIALVCSNMRMSRCSKIKCCCFECIRENLTESEYNKELDNQHQLEHQASASAVNPQQEGQV